MQILAFLLLILKLSGLFLSSITLIGSERLLNFENNIRKKVAQNILSLTTSFPYTKYPSPKFQYLIFYWEEFWDKKATPFLIFSVIMGGTILFIYWSGTQNIGTEQSNTVTTISQIWLILPFLIFSPMLLAIPILVFQIFVENIKHPDFSILTDSSPKRFIVSILLWVFGISLSVISIFFVVSTVIVFLPFVIIFLLVTGIRKFGTGAISGMTIGILVFLRQVINICVYILGKPYLWLDLQVKTRQIESTLVVIGLLLSVLAEVVEYILNI
jgi:hypothetical protein